MATRNASKRQCERAGRDTAAVFREAAALLELPAVSREAPFVPLAVLRNPRRGFPISPP